MPPAELNSSEDSRRRSSIPAWVASVILHAALLVVLGLTLQLVPKGASADGEREIAGEVVLKHLTEQGEYYETRDSTSDQPHTGETKAPSVNDLLKEADPGQAKLNLPQELLGGPSTPGDNGGGADALIGNPGQSRSASGSGGKTKFYDVESEGNTFVYVIDRSASMYGGGGVKPLNAAKAEVLASLSSLKKVNQFEIIFYNDKMSTFGAFCSRSAKKRPAAFLTARLNFADERHVKFLAPRFMNTVTADGPTYHLDGLLKALSLQPDVVYFLTDAVNQRLDETALRLVRSRNRHGSTIHAIEFGQGPQVRGDHWLVDLAKQNAGKFRYVDIRQLGR